MARRKPTRRSKSNNKESNITREGDEVPFSS